MSEKQVLVVSYHTPQPDRDSGARRISHLIELLEEFGWTVTFLAADGVGEQYDVRALQQRGIAVYDGYRKSIDDLVLEIDFDLAFIAFWKNVERYLHALRSLSARTHVIVDSVDLHFLREAREVFNRSATKPGLTAGHGERFVGELNAYASADAVLTVSQREADLINDLLCESELAMSVPDFEDLPATAAPFSRRNGIVCIGSFQHSPNIDAVEFLCREVLTLIDADLLAEHPVRIIGNAPNEAVREAARKAPHVRLVGWVPSVQPYLESARVSVVPLLHGAGTKRKLVQALVAGTPSVATTIGIEGLDLTHGENILVADEPEAFAAAISTLLTDSKLWARLAASGRRHIVQTNGRDFAKKRFAEALAALQAREPRPGPPLTALSPTAAARDDYELLIADARRTARSVLPDDSCVAVVSRGDSRLVELPGHRTRHFPEDPDGKWAGHYPEDSAEAIARLEALRTDGADHLLFPATAFWWLDHYTDFARHLRRRYRIVHQDDACMVFSLAAHRDTAPRLSLVERASSAPSDVDSDVKVIAFYLPQFHPIPENDAWWGEGFTEWRNVASAEPQFPGHYQPHVPADLGFYDLRLAETPAGQAELARRYGVHGFCYYHYWFSGTRLLERPFNEVLVSGEPDLPFALCWANDPWSRRWDGREEELLQRQTYSREDDLEHIRWLLPALADPRAITVDGKPMFLIYRAQQLPDPQRTCDIWRAEVEKAGLPGIHLVAVETAWDLGWDATQVGFDAKVLFQPQFGWLITHVGRRGGRIPIEGADELHVYDYDDVRRAVADIEPSSYRRYESVFPSWDNTARVGGRAVVLHNSTPESYEVWLRDAVTRARLEPPEHRLVFVNAWNEWAEGCHLEPDQRHGHAYLEATRNAQLPIDPSATSPNGANRLEEACLG